MPFQPPQRNRSPSTASSRTSRRRGRIRTVSSIDDELPSDLNATNGSPSFRRKLYELLEKEAVPCDPIDEVHADDSLFIDYERLFAGTPVGRRFGHLPHGFAISMGVDCHAPMADGFSSSSLSSTSSQATRVDGEAAAFALSRIYVSLD